MNENPYAAPQAHVDDIAAYPQSPPLWNPNAAANWSLLFSPAFMMAIVFVITFVATIVAART